MSDIAAAINGEAHKLAVFLANTSDGISSILPFDLSTRYGALQAMPELDRVINRLTTQRGTVGAFQSRLHTAVNNLQQSTENIASAESRIADIDTAAESAKLVKGRILQQAGAAILSQANQLPALALALLEG